MIIFYHLLQAGKADNDTIESSNIKLYLDMSNQVIGFVLLRTFFLAFQSFAQDYLSILGYNPATVTLPITIEKVIYGTVNPSMTEFMAPGVIILIAYYATTALTALSLVLERKDGLLERSLVAGVNSLEFLVSHIMTQTLVLTIQEILMLITTFYIFEVPSRGPMIWVFSLTFFQGKLPVSLFSAEHFITLPSTNFLVFPHQVWPVWCSVCLSPRCAPTRCLRPCWAWAPSSPRSCWVASSGRFSQCPTGWPHWPPSSRRLCPSSRCASFSLAAGASSTLRWCLASLPPGDGLSSTWLPLLSSSRSTHKLLFFFFSQQFEHCSEWS